VLTSRHGIAVEENGTGSLVDVRLVVGPRGGIKLVGPLQGTVVWAGPGDLDAALVELPAGTEIPDGVAC